MIFSRSSLSKHPSPIQAPRSKECIESSAKSQKEEGEDREHYHRKQTGSKGQSRLTIRGEMQVGIFFGIETTTVVTVDPNDKELVPREFVTVKNRVECATCRYPLMLRHGQW